MAVMPYAHPEPKASLLPCQRVTLLRNEAEQAIACIWASSSLQETIELAYKGHSYRLNDILVDKFCPSDLIEPGTAPLLLEQQHNDVHFSNSAEATLQQRPELRVGCFRLQQDMPMRAGLASLSASQSVPKALLIPACTTSSSPWPYALTGIEVPGMTSCKAPSLHSGNDGMRSVRRKLRSWPCSLQGTATRPTPDALRVWPCSQRTAPSSTGAPLRAAPTIPPSTLCRPHASRLRPRGRAPFQRYACFVAPEVGTCCTLKGHARTCATWHNASRLDVKLAETANILASKEHWVHPHRQPTAGFLLHTCSNECSLRLTHKA